jgi:tRNA(Ile)-lysidine synthase
VPPISTEIDQQVIDSIAAGLNDANLPLHSPLVVAFSGGVDSSVLLQLALLYRDQYHCELHAVHIHHGLSDNADAWSKHCDLQCRINDVVYHQQRVVVDTSSRKSIEAEARKARYHALLSACEQIGGVLLLGQHAEDQLETVLLQLKRGAGPQGLAGMAESQWRGSTLVLRPMLNLKKEDIVSFAHSEALSWVEDESNFETSFDRNFLRNDIIPDLIARWPELAKTVSRSALLCAEQSHLINDTANQFLNDCQLSPVRINGDALSTLSIPWQKAVIRLWFTQRGQLAPSKAQLDELLSMLGAKQDATPEMSFKWGKVARSNGDIYWVVKPTEDIPATLALNNHETTYLAWLSMSVTVSLENSDEAICLKTDMRGLKVKPEQAGVSKELKNWFKVWRVPRWERQGVPVIFIGDTPVAVIANRECLYLRREDSSAKVDIRIEHCLED